MTILKILAGLIIMNEISFYTVTELVTVGLCAGLIVGGILINLRKSAILRHHKEEIVSLHASLITGI